MKVLIKKIFNKILNGNVKKKSSTLYWWELHESAKKKGLKAF